MHEQTLEQLAKMICGDLERFPVYRSGGALTKFFQGVGLSHCEHHGSTRFYWTLKKLKNLSDNDVKAVILGLANPRIYKTDRIKTEKAIVCLNEILRPEGLQVYIIGIEPRLKECEPCFWKDTVEVKDLSTPDFQKLKIESKFSELLSVRWSEVEICFKNGAYLAATILMGSILECLFLSFLSTHPKEANQSQLVQKKKVKDFSTLKLSEMIDVAHELRWIDNDVKHYSHSLREFRNFVHPYKQVSQDFCLDKDTCRMNLVVVQATVNDLISKFGG